MKPGHASEVNSAGTSFSALSRIGLAAILTEMSISEAGSSGSVWVIVLDELIFLEEEQPVKKISIGRAAHFRKNVFILETNIISSDLLRIADQGKRARFFFADNLHDRQVAVCSIGNIDRI